MNPTHPTPAMRNSIIPVIALLCVQAPARADDDIPLLRPEERRAVEQQTDAFNAALTPALADAAKSTVRVWAGHRRLAYGTVVGDGKRILTKWSEVARATDPIRVEGAGGAVLAASIAGVYEEEDLVLLEVAGGSLAPVVWFHESPALGGFIAAPQPDGRPAAFGVVSVLERNLRDTDQAFLGIVGTLDFKGPGVEIQEVSKGTGAAAAGLKPGDVILKVGDRRISGLMELKNALVGVKPGSSIPLVVRMGKEEKKINVELGNRPDLPNFPGDRLRQMERMGGPISRVRDSFSRVIQTDMRPKPDQIGGPVVDLKGRVIGITVARADRTRSFVMPASAVEELLAKPGIDPSLAKNRETDEQQPMTIRRMGGQPRQMGPDGEARLRRHLAEMQQLMDFMREEMDGLEQGR